MSFKILRVVSVFTLGLFCGFSLFFSSGIVGVTKKPNHIFVNPGCFCHGDSTSPNVRVWLEGPDSMVAGEEAMFALSVAKDSNVAAGFNVATFFGSLGIVDSVDTQLLPVGSDSLELTHIQPKAANGRDTISWQFRYRAPSTVGLTDTLYANGNSVDLSFDPSGDHWNFADNHLIRITGTSDARENLVVLSYQLQQNYPNPFNPSTTISYRLPGDSQVRLTVFDILGGEIATLVNEVKGTGAYSVTWDGMNGAGKKVSSGIYLYQLTAIQADGARGFVEIRKMLLLK